MRLPSPTARLPGRAARSGRPDRGEYRPGCVVQECSRTAKGDPCGPLLHRVGNLAVTGSRVMECHWSGRLHPCMSKTRWRAKRLIAELQRLVTQTAELRGHQQLANGHSVLARGQQGISEKIQSLLRGSGAFPLYFEIIMA